MKKRLITSALPYVNNIPHLGNLIQVLSADVFARFCRLRGYETLYVCGTDEYGTATETKALEEEITPRELCDRYFVIHRDIYDWFRISFDKFGRTSTPEQTAVTQDIFNKLDAAGFIEEEETSQLFCEACSRFLADRYVRGECPVCGYSEARGDQCEECGKLLDPTELVAPRCGVCGSTPVPRNTKHLYIDLPGILPVLEKWMAEASVKGFWANNAVAMTKSWIRDGLKKRCITRDLKWGIPVPKAGYEDKVFYVWFDAPIGYISITATHTKDWEYWWKNRQEVELFQFIGKDNIPFHTVIFPSSLLGSGEPWTMLHHMSSTEYLNYEGGKFSKSKGIGVFGNDVMDTGIPADVWRFYIFYNRPEKSDALFMWKDFQEKVNGELIGNLANLVNRTLSFVHRFYEGRLPEGPSDSALWTEVRAIEAEITAHLERAELRDAFRKTFQLSSLGNKAFQDGEPWKKRTEAPSEAAGLIRDLTYLVRDLAVLISPYIPATAEKIGRFMGIEILSWETLGLPEGIDSITMPEILFTRLEDKDIEEFKQRFSGSQKERRMEKEAKEKAQAEPVMPHQWLSQKVDLRVALITGVERHPAADKLYIEELDCGFEKRQIVSGLVPHYKAEELLGKHIILVANLKPAKLRGTESKGMLLAADDGKGTVEVLDVPASLGAKVLIEGAQENTPGEGSYIPLLPEIDIDTFFSVPITVKDYTVFIGEKPLKVEGRTVTTRKVREGTVG